MHITPVASGLLALASTASAAVKGFNYGSTFTTGAAKQQSDFEAEFTAAQKLPGTSGFTSARLYTMVQAGTANDPISAIPAAIKTKTTLLLGLWASVDQVTFTNEITALKAAIDKYGDNLVDLIDGISVGSEDLYRNSPVGIAAKSNVGENPDVLAKYIEQTKKAIAGTVISKASIGHVDTWTAWVNNSNQAVIDACDWIGVDAYPYFQDTMPNDISKSASLFDDAVDQTKGAVGGKPVWITETGFPVSGKTVGQAKPSTDNAKTYWDDVGCAKLFDKVNTWWYTMQDASPDTPDPSFGLIGSSLDSKPLYDLSCKDVPAQSSTASGSGGSTSTGASKPTGTGTGSGPVGTGTGSGSGSGSGTGTGSGSSGGPGSNATVTTGSPSATSSMPASAASRSHSGALVAAFLAVMVAVLAL